jgi:DNA-directed RNA polymerase specialized sigma24 family protein
LIAQLVPIVEARVARVLVRRRGGSGRDARQEVEDLAQEVFLVLFDDGARILRAWDPTRGLSLDNFVGLVAERQAASILRSGRRSPWTDAPAEDAELEGAQEPAPPEGEVRLISREALDQVVDRLRETLTPRGLELFFRLIVEEEPVENVCRTTGMSPDAVYAWRSRLAKQVRKIAQELSEASSSARMPLREQGKKVTP